MLIGLAGHARVGKDTIAMFMCADHGYQRVGLADKVKDCVYALNPFVTPRYVKNPKRDRVREEWLDDQFKKFPTGTWRLQQVVDKLGWEVAKESPEIRELMQRMGTEVGRQIMGADVWIKAAFPDGVDQYDRVVISDIRFESEAKFVRDNGGVVVHVSRPGYEPANGHSSEAGVKYDSLRDFEILNSGDLADLKRFVRQFLMAINTAFRANA